MSIAHASCCHSKKEKMNSSILEALVNAICVSSLVMGEAVACLLGMEMYIASEFGISTSVDYAMKGAIVLLVGFYGFKLARHVWMVERGIINPS